MSSGRPVQAARSAWQATWPAEPPRLAPPTIHFHFVQAGCCGTALQSQGLRHGQACSWRLCYMSTPWCQIYFKCWCQLLTRSVTTAAPLAFLSDLCWAVLKPLGCFLNCFRNKHIHSRWSTVWLWTRNNPDEKTARYGSYLVCSSCVIIVLSHCPQSLAEAGM